jgi:calcineurin-like phosphoesterase family protein
MSTVRICADPHLEHENMAIKRGFKSSEEHDEHLIAQWNSVVKPKDLTYMLGDVTMEKTSGYKLLDRLNGRIIVIGGNHDMPRHCHELLNHVESIGGMVKYKGIFLTHAPIHPRELKYRIPFNIHGHIHEYVCETNGLFGRWFKKPDPRYICVSMEQINYIPKTIGELIPGWDDKSFRNNYILQLKKKRGLK